LFTGPTELSVHVEIMLLPHPGYCGFQGCHSAGENHNFVRFGLNLTGLVRTFFAQFFDCLLLGHTDIMIPDFD
jgi:hypothetical protein